jgi:hypothetical protein
MRSVTPTFAVIVVGVFLPLLLSLILILAGTVGAFDRILSGTALIPAFFALSVEDVVKSLD